MISGMTPGLTTILASNLSYSIEKNIRKRKNEYNHNGDINCLVSAETANNSGFLTSLLPLVIFGIPIIGSEAMILNLIEQGGTAVGLNTLMADGMFKTVIVFYFLAGILSLFIAWQGARYCLMVYEIPKNVLLGLITVVSIFSVAVYSLNSTGIAMNFILLFVFFFIGYLLRRTDTSPVIFAFLIYPFLESSLYRFFIIHLS
jgi:TctA family transporter